MSQRRELNPRPLPYQGSALPLSYIGQKLSGKRDSNSQHSAWKADALPIELFPLTLSTIQFLNKKPRKAKDFFLIPMKFRTKKIKNVGRAGFEPAKVNTNGFTVRPRWPLEYLPN